MLIKLNTIHTESVFTKSVPSKLKISVKGGAAVDHDSGEFCLKIKLQTCLILMLYN